MKKDRKKVRSRKKVFYTYISLLIAAVVFVGSFSEMSVYASTGTEENLQQ